MLLGGFGSLGKILILIGLAFIAVGVAIIVLGRFPQVPLGRLPGDIRIERENVRFYFPLVTCILLSLIVTILWSLISYLRK